jgi:hypothetical protein
MQILIKQLIWLFWSNEQITAKQSLQNDFIAVEEVADEF